eukprot:26126-Prymnesium_polylepis.1
MPVRLSTFEHVPPTPECNSPVTSGLPAPLIDGTGFWDAFTSQSGVAGLTIAVATKFGGFESDLDAHYRLLKASNVHILVLACQAKMGGPFLRGALAADLGGEGYLWIGADAVSQAELWLSDEMLRVDPVLRLQ